MCVAKGNGRVLVIRSLEIRIVKTPGLWLIGFAVIYRISDIEIVLVIYLMVDLR